MSNHLSPSGNPVTGVFTSWLFADPISANGSSDNLGELTTVDIGGVRLSVSAAIEIRSKTGGLLLPRMDNGERADLVVVPGMMLYNITSDTLDFKLNSGWISVANGNGNVVGPAISITNDIAIFGDTTGKLLIDSGVPITAVALSLERQNYITAKGRAPRESVIHISNLGVVAFNSDLGILSLGTFDDFFIASSNAEDSPPTVSSVFYDRHTANGLPTSSSCLLELQGTTGSFVLTRLTTVQMNALPDPVNGMILYNTNENAMFGYQDGSWVNSTATGTVSSVAVTGSLGITVGGSPITDSGTITLTLDADLQGLSSLSSIGIVTRLGSGDYAERSITGTGGQIIVTNGSGVSGNPTISLATTAVNAGSFTNMNATVDALGRITAASSGSNPGTGTVTSVATEGSTGLVITGGPITTNGTLAFTLGSELQALSAISANGFIARTAPNTYAERIIVGEAGSVTVTNGDGILGNPTISLENTSVIAGSYLNSNITINADGRITAATNGAAGLGTVTSVGAVAGAVGIAGLVITGSPITTDGSFTFSLDPTIYGLTAIGGNPTGILVNAGSGSYVGRTLSTASSSRITVNNGSGVLGDPVFDLVTTGVTPGSYPSGNFSVDAYGRITAADSGNGGSWDPDFKFSGGSGVVTYVSRKGRWRLIGTMVYFTATIILSSKGTNIGIARILGLPIAPSTDGGPFTCLVNGVFSSALTTYGYVENNFGTNTIFPSANSINGAESGKMNLSDLNFLDTSKMYISGTYWV